MIRIPNLLMMLVMLACNQQLLAQNSKEKKNKKTIIKIISEEDDKKIIIDTTFENAEQSDIDAFLRQQGLSKKNPPPVPPVPPAPSAAPGAPLPPPPAPPIIGEEDKQSFNYHFEMPDFDESLDIDFDAEINNAKDALENAKVEMRRSLEETTLSKEEMEKVMKNLEKELNKLELKDTNHSEKHKHIIIKRKTSDIDEENRNSDIGYLRIRKQLPMVIALSASDKNDSPFVWNSSGSYPGFATVNVRTCYTDKKEKHGKFKHFVKRVTDKILD